MGGSIIGGSTVYTVYGAAVALNVHSSCSIEASMHLSFCCFHEASIPFLFPRQGVASSEHHFSPVFSEGCLLMKYDASTEDYNLKHVV